MSWLWAAMRPLAVPLVRGAFRVKVVGRRHIPRKGAAILASNHLSALDHVVLPMATRRVIVNISKAEHFQRPIKAWFFRQWGVIKLQRGAGDQGAMAAAKQALREGNLFCIYPEGTRSLDGRLHKGHTGVARLALEMRVPVIPVAMVGTFEAKPKGGRTKWFTKCAAIVGPPLDFSHHWGQQDDKAVCRAVTDQVMQAIAALSGQEYVHEYQHNPEVRSHAAAGASSHPSPSAVTSASPAASPPSAAASTAPAATSPPSTALPPAPGAKRPAAKPSAKRAATGAKPAGKAPGAPAAGRAPKAK